MERAVFSTLFSCGFKKKSEASEEQVAESQQKRNEREEREAKELSDKAKGKRTAETSEPSGVIHKLDISERRRRRRRKISRPAARPAGGRSGHQIFGAPVTPPAQDILSVGRIFIIS